MDSLTFLVIVGIFLIVLAGVSFAYYLGKASGESEECDKVGNNHGDTTESESKFYKRLNSTNFCNFVEDIDREEIKGQIREDTKHDWDWFMTTKVFQTAFDDAKMCMLDRYELPDNGKDTLQDYEVMDCGQGNYLLRKKGWSKSARGKGYRVENDFVNLLKSWGWFAMRLPSWLQKGLFRPIDGIFYDPFKKIFGFFQAKYNKKYLHKEEKERIQEVCRIYKTIAYFVWRKDETSTRGLKYIILN